MKKPIKLISLLIFVTIIASLFVSCSQDELTLLNALTKQSDIKSMESKTDMTIALEASGFSAAEQQSFQQVSAMLNGSKITVNQKSQNNENNTVGKGQIDMNVNMGGMSIDTSVWVDTDMSGAKPKLIEIIKLPTMLTAFMPTTVQGKPYMVFDLTQLTSQIPQSSTGNLDYKKLMALSKDLSPKVLEFIKDYFTQFDPGFTPITKKKDTIVNGETLSVYELKLDDESFKKLLDYGVNNFIQNEKAISFTKKIITSLIDITTVDKVEKAKTTKEIDKAFNEVKTGLPAFKEQWNQIMTVIKDVKILGDKGIVIDFGINSDGYIVSQNGTFDFIIDLKAISEAGENISLLQNNQYKKQLSNQTGIIKIGLDFNNAITNINKEVSISLPALTDKNSFNFMEIMNSLMPQEPVKKAAPPAKDTTPPVAPVVNKVLANAKVLSGKAEIGATISVKTGKIIIGTGVVNSKGIYSIAITPQKAKRILLVTAKDKSGNISKATTVTVVVR